MQWLQKAKITVICTQDFMLYDNIIRLSLSLAHNFLSTPRPIPFRADFAFSSS